MIAAQGGFAVQLNAELAYRATGATVVTRNRYAILFRLVGTPGEHARLLAHFPVDRVTRLTLAHSRPANSRTASE